MLTSPNNASNQYIRPDYLSPLPTTVCLVHFFFSLTFLSVFAVNSARAIVFAYANNFCDFLHFNVTKTAKKFSLNSSRNFRCNSVWHLAPKMSNLRQFANTHSLILSN